MSTSPEKNSSGFPYYVPELSLEVLARSEKLTGANGREIVLDEHQQRGMEEAAYALDEGKSPFSIVHPGGSGKTVLEAALLQASQAAKQSIGGSIAETQDIILAVERSLITNIRRHLVELGIDAGQWGMGQKITDRPVIVSSIQALQANKSGLNGVIDPARVALVLGDEADKILTPDRIKILKQFTNATRIGMTATPEWADGRHISDTWGEIVHHMTLREGIEKGVNVPPLFYLFEADVDGDALTIEEGDYKKSELNAAFKQVQIEMAIPEVYSSLIPKSYRHHFPTLVYVPSVDTLHTTTQKLRETFTQEGVRVSSWSGTITSARLSKEIQAFERGEIDVLVLCEMGGRGLDLPRARAILDAYHTLSANKLEQRHSRALRRVRSGSALEKEGFAKDFALIAQILPRANRFRPITLLDVLDAWPDYKPGRVLGLGESQGFGHFGGDREGAPRSLEVDAIVKSLKKRPLKGRVQLIEQANILDQIKLRNDLPQADESGFFEQGGMKYGADRAFERLLGISRPTISNRIKSHFIRPIPGKDSQGRIYDFYPEDAVREACEDLLQELPQADASGFFEKDEVKYMTIKKFTHLLGLSQRALQNRIGNIQPMKGKNIQGKIYDFYPEDAVREACEDLLQELPQADESGFFEKDGMKYGTAEVFGRLLGLSPITIKKRIGSVQSVKGKDIKGHIYDFYPEDAVREACEDLLQELPQADASGFFEKDEVKYGNYGAYSKLLRLNIKTITNRIKSHRVQPAQGKDIQGHIGNFYPEDAVHEACADLLRQRERAE